jgi:hypothetical protein
MEEINYLYGAAVQGIQSFIFQTNELKDIVGASELVERICTETFAKFANNGESILRAAGNIKFIFNDRKDCEKAVLEFPKTVMEMAPGITISQAVVAMEGKNKDYSNASDELEKRLRIQRNKPVKPINLGLIGTLHSRKTGLPVVNIDGDDYLDEATLKKKEASKVKKRNGVYKEMTNLTRKAFADGTYPGKITDNIDSITDANNWIAIVHADGNGLGQVVQKICKNENVAREFSTELEKATVTAAKTASTIFKDKEIIPCRPIVIGGDDFTVVIRGSLALNYVNNYLTEFEKQTKILMSGIADKFEAELDAGQQEILRNGLSACAGIAYIKSSYPFYYGYNLAETLCSRAKADAKKPERINANGGLAPSCLMFHKVQDSFVTNFDSIVTRELTPCSNVSFEYGPYYIKDKTPDDMMSIDSLKNLCEKLTTKDGGAIKSHLRQWITVLHDKGMDAADQHFKRLKTIVSKEDEQLVDKLMSLRKKKVLDKEILVYSIYDILSLYSIENIKTKGEEETK